MVVRRWKSIAFFGHWLAKSSWEPLASIVVSIDLGVQEHAESAPVVLSFEIQIVLHDLGSFEDRPHVNSSVGFKPIPDRRRDRVAELSCV